MLHMSNGFLMAGVGFSLIDILNQSHRVSVPPISCICCYGRLLLFYDYPSEYSEEFFEFFADQILRTDMQKDAIVNSISSITMNDISINKSILVSGIDDVIFKRQSSIDRWSACKKKKKRNDCHVGLWN